ncbi:ABC transporter ATP-binding protein [Anaerocolumna sp. AGMB13020]|uniref:ABC transporter ATP-binding protein n=1 Tax=Anaerocolumna sp. AGMB13020 TaxID=3081750 RepID=UPI002952A649|nr:ABC transporter ATP-binding protein [Anaerocolumna sp. AGMB13020]WOO37915.1 ABC transporter ATP-binding protein [Anaerocolumna sp. AGMB13020]
MKNIMSVRNLKKNFKENNVLKGINFEVHKGEVLCILGPNGAGKSTTINILTAALGSDEGSIYFKDAPISKVLRSYKQSIGIVPQEIALYEELSAERNLSFFASLYGLSGNKLKAAVEEALDFAGLKERRKDKVKTFSGGMKRRLNIACAIAHHPELVIMDEPTVGIDPQSRNHILSSIKELQAQGMTVIYTTHYMEEVEAISSRIIIMDHGAIIAEGTKESLKEEIENEKRYTIEVEENGITGHDEFFTIEGVKNVKIEGNTIEITSLKGIENLDRIISLLSDRGEKIRNISSEAASLEMVFLKLTGRKLRD